MSYAQVSDMEARYPARDLIQLTNEVTPLILTFSGSPGTIQLPFGNLTPMVFVQSAPNPLPSPQTTYVLTTDYSVNNSTGLITRNGGGSIPSGATVYVSADNGNYLQTFLNDAGDEIDAYLEARFALPLTDPPAILTRINCELAMFHLQALRPIHDLAFAKEIYEKNIAFLKEVADGDRTLGISTDGQEPADPSNPQVIFEQNVGGNTTVPSRVFSRATLKGF
jgi:phage gp36-like protein